ncbi:hypothetical protein Taro_023744 [Colocasia esculenta]|uniref:Mei2-like C-terminal RNA recognition motif domain-containing protein n=1 Tax=Colocasia esculenta TaxID=4460 RepID=A0A843V4Z3_COLES|nr:hypothetical protein [Colocasia esculenta]
MLMKLLDDHCMEVNNQIEPDSPDGPPSEYDFVYLPMDFRTNSCLGYAFVNFTTAAAAWRFYQALNNFKWEMFGTKKITRICYARIQGKEAMLANFGASSFRCDSDEYLPVTFSPPRSGAEPCPPPTLVGKRWPRSTNTPRQQLLQQAAAATAAGAPDISSSSFSSTPARSSRKT